MKPRTIAQHFIVVITGVVGAGLGLLTIYTYVCQKIIEPGLLYAYDVTLAGHLALWVSSVSVAWGAFRYVQRKEVYALLMGCIIFLVNRFLSLIFHLEYIPPEINLGLILLSVACIIVLIPQLQFSSNVSRIAVYVVIGIALSFVDVVW